jgi:hypothetical protein
VQGFLAFMAVNATVVFARGAGLAVCAALAAAPARAQLKRPRPGRPPRPRGCEAGEVSVRPVDSTAPGAELPAGLDAPPAAAAPAPSSPSPAAPLAGYHARGGGSGTGNRSSPSEARAWK